jgi:hypothetical protein
MENSTENLAQFQTAQKNVGNSQCPKFYLANVQSAYNDNTITKILSTFTTKTGSYSTPNTEAIQISDLCTDFDH